MARKKDVIDPLLEEVLYELIAEKINAIPPAEAEETVKKLQAFLQCNAYRNQQKRITIASLVDLLQIMEIRIIDLYEAAGIKVSWPNEKSETFNLHLKKLSDAEKIKRIHEVVIAIDYSSVTPDIFKSQILLADDSPMSRPTLLIQMSNQRISTIKTHIKRKRG